MKKLLLTIVLCLGAAYAAQADEGMWLIQCLDKALAKNMKARGLKLGAKEIYNEEAGSISDAIVSLGFYCSGSMISEDGLMITNHHCAYGDVSAMSTPEHNWLETGFWAHSRADEVPIKGKEFYFLNRVLDVTEEVIALKDSLKLEGKPFGSRRLTAVMENKYSELYGMEAGLAGMWSGTKYYICLYTKYTDIRLVAAPPVQVASFGGDEDNWEWPQHKADFAIYRIYDDNGEPLHPKRWLKISQKGYKEKDFAMVIGYPGRTARYTSAAEMEQTINVERPITNRIRRGQMEIIRKWMDADPAIRMKYTDAFFSLSNVAENQEGEEACVHRFKVIENRREWEKGLRASSPENAAVLDRLDAEYASISDIEKQKVYYRETLVRGLQIGRTLTRMAVAEKDLEKQRQQFAAGLEETDPRVEKELLAFAVKEFMSNMEAWYQPIHKELKEKFGEDYAAMAAWLWDNSCLAGFGIVPNDAIVNGYAGGIKQDPLYRFTHELTILMLNTAEKHVAPLSELRRDYTRARYKYLKENGVVQYPDANSTMRITYGRVLPIKPRDAVSVSWQSTAAGLREKYNPANYDFALPKDFVDVLPPPGFPVNFLTDNDITGGNSGSPVMNAKGELIGLAFDGNKESLASNYESVPGYNMCVCVDIRYVFWVVRYLGKQDYILAELGL